MKEPKDNNIEILYMAEKELLRAKLQVVTDTINSLNYENITLNEVDLIFDILDEANNKIEKIKDKSK